MLPQDPLFETHTMMKHGSLNDLLPNGARRLIACLGAAVAMCGAAGAAHAQGYVNATVGGQIAPGVYGRVDIGGGAPPVLLYQQPVVVAPPAVYVPRSPIYMYVPPGHAKNWSRHCARYAACGQPVYFLKDPPRRHGYYRGDRDRYEGPRHHDRRERWRDRDRDRDHDRDDRRRHGRSHGRDD